MYAEKVMTCSDSGRDFNPLLKINNLQALLFEIMTVSVKHTKKRPDIFQGIILKQDCPILAFNQQLYYPIPCTEIIYKQGIFCTSSIYFHIDMLAYRA